MPRNGSGQYSAPTNSWNPAINGLPATAADWQAVLNDIVSALTQSVSRDGQTAMTGNLPMAGNKVTGLGNATATGDALTFAQLFSQGQQQDVPAAATTDIGAQTSTLINVTGAATITSFGTHYNGPRFLRFAGVCTLTNSATLVLPGGANITTAAGDSLIAVPLGNPATGWRVVASSSSSLVGYLPSGAGAIATNVQSKLRDTVSVRDFGADPTGTNDSSLFIQAALNAHNYVVVPTGTYRCDNMIELGLGKTLHLFGGAYLIRMSAHSASTDPVVWMKGADCSFIGSGQNSSGVRSQNRCPIGVVSLGHRDMTQSHANVTYCTLLNMRISGPLVYGQTTGDPDVALYMANPQFRGLASYFHNVSGLLVADANFGIWLCGWANANTITNIQGYTLGNTTLGVNKNAFIYCNGGLDNAVANVFFHQSPDSIGLLVEDYNNTSIPGGSLHQPYANSFSGYVCEQGGSAALGLKALSGQGSFYEIRHNVAGGNFTYPGFKTSNWFFGLHPVPDFATLRADVSLIGGATDDGVNVQKINGGQAIGATSQRTYTATGTITITVRFGTALNGNFWRSGLVELMFDGFAIDSAGRQVARYYIPIEGLSAWNIGTPVAIYGTGLTITQTANSTTSVTFTVTGTAGAGGLNSIFATVTSNAQGRLA